MLLSQRGWTLLRWQWSLAEKYSRTIELIYDCKTMLEQADKLASQEASLAISLSQLEMAKKRKVLIEID